MFGGGKQEQLQMLLEKLQELFSGLPDSDEPKPEMKPEGEVAVLEIEADPKKKLEC
jgi:hypothetical protein